MILFRLVAQGHHVSIFYETKQGHGPYPEGIEDATIKLKDPPGDVKNPAFVNLLWNGNFNSLFMSWPYVLGSKLSMLFSFI